jgi:hypothetical protein
VLVEERIELDPKLLIDDVLGGRGWERRHARSISLAHIRPPVGEAAAAREFAGPCRSAGHPFDMRVREPRCGPADKENPMSKYMLIMRGTDVSNAAMMANIDEMMATTRQFIEDLVKAGVYVAAEGLDDPGKGVVVEFGGETPVVTDGPYGETKELFGGFFLLDVASKQEAVEWAKRVPAAPGSKIEVRRVPGEDEVPQDTEGNGQI